MVHVRSRVSPGVTMRLKRTSSIPANSANLPANDAVCVAVPKSLTVYAPTRLSLVTKTAPDMVNEPPAQRWANVSWLAGYRRPVHLGAELADQLLDLARRPVSYERQDETVREEP